MPPGNLADILPETAAWIRSGISSRVSFGISMEFRWKISLGVHSGMDRCRSSLIWNLSVPRLRKMNSFSWTPRQHGSAQKSFSFLKFCSNLTENSFKFFWLVSSITNCSRNSTSSSFRFFFLVTSSDISLCQ